MHMVGGGVCGAQEANNDFFVFLFMFGYVVNTLAAGMA